MLIPEILDIGFKINEEQLWKEVIPVEEISILELEHNLDIPYLDKKGTDAWNLTPRELIKNFFEETLHAEKVNQANLNYPIEIHYHMGRWIILDGVHRFTKAVMQKNKTIKIRRVSKNIIKKISKPTND